MNKTERKSFIFSFLRFVLAAVFSKILKPWIRGGKENLRDACDAYDSLVDPRSIQFSHSTARDTHRIEATQSPHSLCLKDSGKEKKKLQSPVFRSGGRWQP